MKSIDERATDANGRKRQRTPAIGATHAGRTRIERGNLHDEVANVLRDMIIQNQLPPGAHIPEIELCSQLGISRTPLREAIRLLTSEGLVTPLPRRGAVVATPTREEFQGLFYVLGAIESVCAPMACENFSDEEISEVRRLHKKMIEHQRRGQREEYYRANQEIHQAIVRGSRNQFLVKLHQSFGVRILRARFFVDVPKSSWTRALHEHDQILALIERRDGRKLADILLRHMDGSWHDFEKTLQRPGPGELRVVAGRNA